MSVEALSWALNDAPDVPPELVAVLVGLANHAGEDGRHAFPSQARLARYARKSDRAVRNDLVRLLDLGLIREGDQRLVSHIPGGRRPKVYDLAIERKTGSTVPATPEAHDRSHSSGHTGTAVPVTPDAGVRSPRNPASDKPSLNQLPLTAVGTEGDSSARDDVDSHPAARAIAPEDRARLDQLGAEAAAARAQVDRDRREAASIAGCDVCDEHGLLAVSRERCMHPKSKPEPGTGRAAFRAELAKLKERQQRTVDEVRRVDQLAPCPTCDRTNGHLAGCPDDPATELPADAVLVHAPSPNDRSGPANRDQLTALAVGYPGPRDARLAWCSRNLGRPVDSTTELTKAEASKLLDLLARDEPEAPPVEEWADTDAEPIGQVVVHEDEHGVYGELQPAAFGPDDPPF